MRRHLWEVERHALLAAGRTREAAHQRRQAGQLPAHIQPVLQRLREGVVHRDGPRRGGQDEVAAPGRAADPRLDAEPVPGSGVRQRREAARRQLHQPRELVLPQEEEAAGGQRAAVAQGRLLSLRHTAQPDAARARILHRHLRDHAQGGGLQRQPPAAHDSDHHRQRWGQRK
ncbi:hypothetical protein STCU_11238 [Strigomonas culicis]|uniref:Uncharacterized protein n=1 Tax=Strigomonas culicis TaxID=28005 RepID=S9THT0_9TRYP|nr:hypothetical protein STCU_11238 [Strigomonas culicis]|eukprot:EPY16459.1 hypothetical protein STCU_11238 [Strigomonas culicis]